MCAGSNRTDRVRVGFIINFDFDSWLGGFNYLKTLIDSVMALPERTIEPVIFTGKQNFQRLSQAFPNNEIVISGMTDRWSLPWTFRMILMLIFRHDFFLDSLLKKHGIRILSHAGLTDSYSGFPSLCWIPDFQHRRLPDFFSPLQRAVRDRRFMKLCRLSGGVILSSRDAQETLKEFYPKAVEKSFVLNFVTRPDDGYDAAPLDALLNKYRISFPYFHVPNQFWGHKNHRLIVEALRILRGNGKTVHVVATGNTSDYRKSGVYAGLMKQVEDYGLAESFKSLGVIPYRDLMAIMWHSVAVINPSFFEGWSTTVEEAKSMGKKVILSDIPVHREQNPERGVFVDPENPDGLADALDMALKETDIGEEMKYADKAKRDLPNRRDAFGLRYQEIVMMVLKSLQCQRDKT